MKEMDLLEFILMELYMIQLIELQKLIIIILQIMKLNKKMKNQFQKVLIVIFQNIILFTFK